MDDALNRNKRARLDDTEEAGTMSIGSDEDYEETCRIGEGGFAVVAKARHRATGRTVAIKRLLPPEDEEEPPDLLHEAALLAACAGVPFVVQIHEVVRDPATAEVGLVMECAGQNMGAFLGQHRRSGGTFPLPEPTLRGVMSQLLTAASGIHARGIVHRDIKLRNVLVADDLRAVKLCDLGVGMRTSEERPPYAPSGTPGYRAPEILLELPEYDARVDAWSLGVVMAEVLTGRRLFNSLWDPPDEELHGILRVLGVPDVDAWPGFLDTPFACSSRPELDLRRPNVLRQLVPENLAFWSNVLRQLDLVWYFCFPDFVVRNTSFINRQMFIC